MRWHMHTLPGMAVSAQEDGLLPVHMYSHNFWNAPELPQLRGPEHAARRARAAGEEPRAEEPGHHPAQPRPAHRGSHDSRGLHPLLAPEPLVRDSARRASRQAATSLARRSAKTRSRWAKSSSPTRPTSASSSSIRSWQKARRLLQELDMTQRNTESPQRFRRQVRQRQRLGLGVGERAVREELPADGHPGVAAQHLPVQHPGPAHLVRGARDGEGPPRPPRRRRPDGGDEPADLEAGRERGRPGRLPVLRQHQAAAAVEVPRRHQRDRHAAHRDLQRGLHQPARAAAVQEHHLRRRARRPDGHRARGDRRADRRAVQGQGEAAQAQPQRAAAGPEFRAENT